MGGDGGYCLINICSRAEDAHPGHFIFWKWKLNTDLISSLYVRDVCISNNPSSPPSMVTSGSMKTAKVPTFILVLECRLENQWMIQQWQHPATVATSGTSAHSLASISWTISSCLCVFKINYQIIRHVLTVDITALSSVIFTLKEFYITFSFVMFLILVKQLLVILANMCLDA